MRLVEVRRGADDAADEGGIVEQVEESVDEFVARTDVLRERLHTHPGRLAVERWNSVRLVHDALRWNEHFLLHHVDFSTPEGEQRAWAMFGQEPEQTENLRVFWLFLFTFLANYTAMNSTLIDHVRGVMAGYRGTPFASEEEARRKALGYAPVTQFLKDLRNFISHVSTPGMLFQTTFGDGQISFSARLRTDSLLASKRISAVGRQYLDGREAVDIEEAVKEYATNRKTYYEWLFAESVELHRAERADHDRLVVEYNNAFGRPTRGRP